MSESPESSAVAALKAQAKQLLALARAGDSVVIIRLRASLPKLAQYDDAKFGDEVLLADVHHAIARERGHKSWAELKRVVEAADPVQLQAERFLHAVREDDGTHAQQILGDSPAIAQYSVHTAAAACDVVALQKFLDADQAAVNAAAMPDNREPIIYACGSPLVRLDGSFMASSVRCVRLLLERGANANASVPYGNDGVRIAALYFASVSNNVEVVRMLLAAGANPNDGESIYHSAERNYRDVMQLLVDAGADVGDRSAGYDNSPLYFLAGHKPTSALCATSELGMRWLLDHGADPNVPSYLSERYRTWPSSGETPLHRVAEFGKGVPIAQALVEHGANVNATRADGRTPLALAVRMGNVPVARYLESAGADSTQLSAVDQLLGACAIPDEVRARQLVADHPDLVSQLALHDRHAIAHAAEEGRIDSVRLMVSLGWSLSAESAWGATPLHHAAWFGRPEMVRVLIGMGAPIDVRDTQFGSSPLAWAAHGSKNCREGHDDEYLAVVNLLLDAGSSRAASYNKWGEPPENLCTTAVARLLKQRGFSA